MTVQIHDGIVQGMNHLALFTKTAIKTWERV